MARMDLLALSVDDLAELTNRGTVKRAQKEADANEPRGAIVESEMGQVTVSWSDGTVCEFPAGKTIHDARCSSGVEGISRHVVRSVLLYQRGARDAGTASADTDSSPAPPPAAVAVPPQTPDAAAIEVSVANTEVAPDSRSDVAPPEVELDSSHRDRAAESGSVGQLLQSPEIAEQCEPAVAGEFAPERGAVAAQSLGVVGTWDPGEISDEWLVDCFGKAAIARARSRFEQGVLVELTRGTKPVARFLDEASTVRFMVPGDPRYATADCAESQWGLLVPMAVWAYRELPARELAGLVALRQASVRVSTGACESAQALLRELAIEGLSHANDHWEQRWRRCESQLREEGLVWPADLATELGQQVTAYRNRDARFDADEAILLLGELGVRLRALTQGTSAVIPTLVRGSRAERAVELKSARLTGLGLNVSFGRKQTVLRAFLYEASQGNVVAVEREFREGDGPARSIDERAAATVVRGVSLGGLAVSQLLLQTAKRTPNGRLMLPRSAAQMTVNPQQFSWESWKPPFAVDGVAQLRARLRLLPPSYLRARRCTEDFFGLAVSACDDVGFDATRQLVSVRARDSQGEVFLIAHPYFERAATGFRRIADWLTQRRAELRFVCGQVRAVAGTPVIRPTLFVFGEGRDRAGVTPWLDGAPCGPVDGASCEEDSFDEDSSSDFKSLPSGDSGGDPESRIEAFWGETRAGLGELLITGIGAVTSREARLAGELANRSQRMGFVRVASELSGFAAELNARSQSVRWEPAAAALRFVQLSCIARIASE